MPSVPYSLKQRLTWMVPYKNTKIIRILGVDPGTATTGWAVLELKEGETTPLGYGCILTDKNWEDADRLVEISKDLTEIIDKYHPQEAAVENIFFFKNQKTIITVAQARGAILLTLKQKGVKVFGYTPLVVKQALAGYGRAEKRQVQEMTKSILGLKSIPQPDDCADAIAIGICHINSRKLKKLVE
jgi:crossover junction endodeoxyribonuclease RuvC